MERIFYLYKIVNQVNGKYYLGKRSALDTSADLDAKYLGSGKLIRRAIKKYGKELFDKEVLGYYRNMADLNAAEKILITENEIADPLCYNISLGGHGGNLGSVALDKLRKTMQTEEYKQHMSDALNNPDVKQKISASLKLTMSDPEWKANFSRIQKEAQNRPAERARNSKNQKEAQNRPDVAAAKSIAMNSAFSNKDTIAKHNAACNTPAFKEARSNNTRGTVWINNGVNQKYVKMHLLDRWVEAGWATGMLRRPK